MRALLIGYGSIGKRHRDVLLGSGLVATVDVVSRRSDLGFATYRTLADVPLLESYDYFIVATETSRHRIDLADLDGRVTGKRILVEKPLWDLSVGEVGPAEPRNKVFVGYNLRFHPLIRILREAAETSRLLSLTVVCGQYLPDWHPGSDYRIGYSANRDRGGGAHLDLSHEIDYSAWISGEIEPVWSVRGRISDLEIDSDDYACLAARTAVGGRIVVVLDYLSRVPVRTIHLNTVDKTLIADVVGGTLHQRSSGEVLTSMHRIDRNETYAAMHSSILRGSAADVCTYAEGARVMRVIESFRPADGRGGTNL